MKFEGVIFVLLAVFQLSTANRCAQNGHELIGDRCYAFVKQRLSYWSALQYCYSFTGTYATLATVDNIIQSNFLASLGSSYFDTNSGTFWIGAYRDSSTDNFRWTDGSWFSYSNFDRGYPTNLNYVAESVVNGKWQTFADTATMPFVCSYYSFGTTVSEGTTEQPTTALKTTTPADTASSTAPYCPWYWCNPSTTEYPGTTW